MKIEEIFNESYTMDSYKEYEKAGVFIIDNPEEFLEVMSQLEKAYSTSASKGVATNE